MFFIGAGGLQQLEWMGGGEEVEKEEEELWVGEGGREKEERPSLLHSAEGLHLEGLSVGAPFPVVFVLSAMTVTLQDVLVSTVARVLVADPAT